MHEKGDALMGKRFFWIICQLSHSKNAVVDEGADST
jgi:hypothetical protein